VLGNDKPISGGKHFAETKAFLQGIFQVDFSLLRQRRLIGRKGEKNGEVMRLPTGIFIQMKESSQIRTAKEVCL